MIRSQSAKDSGICYLENESVVATLANGRSWNIYGTPVSTLCSIHPVKEPNVALQAVPRFSDGAFQYVEAKEATGERTISKSQPFECGVLSCITDIFSRIPEDTEILLTHTPPYKILDQTWRGKEAGCQCLAARLRALKSCRLHAFGHIHDAHGARFGAEGEYFKSSNEDACVAVNGARSHKHSPIIVDLKN
jgi:hypothetical protein